MAIAEKVVARRDPLLALEFHPAAVVALDPFFDLNWGEQGAAPNDDSWQPSTGKWGLIVSFGSFFGELLRREFGGEWQANASQPGNLLETRVVLQGGVQVYPLGFTYKRLRDGASVRFAQFYDRLRAHYQKQPSAQELDGWLRQGKHFEGVGRPDLARVFYDRALALPLPPAKRREVDALAGWVAEAATREAADEGTRAAAETAAPRQEPAAPTPAEAESVVEPSQTADAHLTRAAALFSKSEHEPALAAFERTLELDPGRAAALLGKARALLALGRFADAAAWLDAFAGRNDCEPERSYLRASAALAAGDKPKAHELFARVVDSPRLAPASRDQARKHVAALAGDPAVLLAAALGIQDLGGAVEALGRLNASHPDIAEAWRERGVGLSMLGRVDEAVACLRRAEQLEPAVPESYDHEAVLLAREERHEQAIAALDRGLQQCPASGVLLCRRGVFLTVLGRSDEAARAFDAAIAAEPAYVESWAFKGDLEQKLGKTEQAVASLERYLAAKSGSQEKRVVAARRQLFSLRNAGRARDRELSQRAQSAALAKLEAGAVAEALPAFEEAVRADPLYGEAWLHRGTCLLRLSRPEDALACYREAETLLGPTPHVAQSLAACLLRMERGGEALEAYDRSLAAFTGHPGETLLGKARTLVRLGRRDEALAIYARLVAGAPRDTALVRERADTLAAAGRSLDALVAYENALELSPGDSAAQRAHAALVAELKRKPA